MIKEGSMQRHLPAAAVASAMLFAVIAIGAPAKAAPVAGLSAIPGNNAQASTVIDKAGWRRWRWHRNWWWRWRRW
jgi:hypothetical protein